MHLRAICDSVRRAAANLTAASREWATGARTSAASALLLIGVAMQSIAAQSGRAIVMQADAAAERGDLRAFTLEWNPRAQRGERAGGLALGVAAYQHYAFPRADSLLRRAGWDAGREATGDIARWARLSYARLQISSGAIGRAGDLLAREQRRAQADADTLAWLEALVLRAAIAQKTVGTAASSLLLDSTVRLGVARYPDLHAAVLCRRAGLLGLSGQVDAVRAATDSGLAAARAANSVRLEGACHFVRATIFARLGDTDSLRVNMKLAMDRQRAGNDLPALAAALQWEGFYLLGLGHHERASRRLTEAWSLATAAKSQNVQAWTALTRASLAAELNDHREAMQWLDRADSLMRALDDFEGQRYVLGLRMEFAFAAGDTATTWRALDQVIGMHARAGDLLALYNALSDRVSKAVALGQADRATAALEALNTQSSSIQAAAYVTAREVTAAEVALLNGQVTQALAMMEHAATKVHRAQYAYRHRLAIMQAVALARLGRVPEAISAARDGEAQLNAWRATLADSTLRLYATRTEHMRRPYYTELIASLAQAGHLSDALRLAEAQQARRLREQLAQASAWAGTSTARAVAGDETPPLSALQQRLPNARTAIVEFVAGRGPVPSVALVVLRDTAWAISVPAMDQLEPTIQRVLAQLSSGRSSPAGLRSLGSALLDPLVQPLTERGITHLVIVPDDALHLLPFEAVTLADGQTALAHWSIAYAPAITVASALWEATARDDGVRSPAQRGIVAFGDPVRYNVWNGAEPTLAIAVPTVALPGARQEVGALAATYPGTRVRVGREASEFAFKELARSSGDVLHLAAHGVINAWDGRGAALLLADGNGEDGILYAGEVAALHLEARLVVLSACATNAGDLVRGEGVSGLTTAFLRAGAHAVVTSAWRVSDRATVPFMATLYDALARGAPVAEALRAAQRDAMQRGEAPAVWAAFRVVGNGMLTPRLRGQREG